MVRVEQKIRSRGELVRSPTPQAFQFHKQFSIKYCFENLNINEKIYTIFFVIRDTCVKISAAFTTHGKLMLLDEVVKLYGNFLSSNTEKMKKALDSRLIFRN